MSGWISDSYCSIKPLWSGMGEVVPARTSPTLHPHPLPLCCNYPVEKCHSASIVATSTLRVKIKRKLRMSMKYETTGSFRCIFAHFAGFYLNGEHLQCMHGHITYSDDCVRQVNEGSCWIN